MKYISLLIITSILLIDCAPDKGSQSDDMAIGFRLTPVPFNEVTMEDKFWKPRLKTQVETLVPFA